MRKYIIGIAIGVILVLPAGAFAWNQKQIAKPIIGADCRPSDKVTADGEAYVYDKDKNRVPDYAHQNCSVTVYRFVDGDNVCYVAKGSNAGGIYCVANHD